MGLPVLPARLVRADQEGVIPEEKDRVPHPQPGHEQAAQLEQVAADELGGGGLVQTEGERCDRLPSAITASACYLPCS